MYTRPFVRVPRTPSKPHPERAGQTAGYSPDERQERLRRRRRRIRHRFVHAPVHFKFEHQASGLPFGVQPYSVRGHGNRRWTPAKLIKRFTDIAIILSFFFFFSFFFVVLFDIVLLLLLYPRLLLLFYHMRYSMPVRRMSRVQYSQRLRISTKRSQNIETSRVFKGIGREFNWRLLR